MSKYKKRKIKFKVTEELFQQILAAKVTLPSYTAKTVSMFVRCAIRDKLNALEQAAPPSYDDARLYKERERPTTRQA